MGSAEENGFSWPKTQLLSKYKGLEPIEGDLALSPGIGDVSIRVGCRRKALLSAISVSEAISLHQIPKDSFSITSLQIPPPLTAFIKSFGKPNHYIFMSLKSFWKIC